MTERQARTLSIFLASAMAAALVLDSVTLRLTLAAERAVETVIMRDYEIPMGDAVYAFMSQLGRQSVWEAASLLALVLALACALCAFGGRAARTVLAAAAVGCMVAGPMVSVRIVEAIVFIAGLPRPSAPATRPSSGVVDIPVVDTVWGDVGAALWLSANCLRIAVILAAVALVANLWHRRPRQAAA